MFTWLRNAWKRFRAAGPLRRVLVVAGTMAFIAGIALLSMGIVGVIDDGNNPAESHVPRLGDDVDLGLLLRDTATPAPSATAAPPESATPPPTPEPAPPLDPDGYRMVIDKLGVNGIVDTYGLDEDAVPEVPTGPDAAEAIAWYDFSARPGTGSNAVFAGHNSWYGEAVFTYLHRLQPGDTIDLIGGDGTELLYTVTDVFSVDPEDPSSLEVMRATNSDVVTLITCGGSFVNTGDPVFGGEFSDRVIVRAGLTSVNGVAVSVLTG
jgi:sortase A